MQPHPLLTSQDEHDLKRAEERHARRIREKRKAREYLRWLESLRDDGDEVLER